MKSAPRPFIIVRDALILVGAMLLFASLALYYYATLCSWALPNSTARIALFADPQMEGDGRARRESLGEFSNFMNDIYQKHIVDSICSLNPTYAVILGDIFSYQQLPSEEFEKRFLRFQHIFSCFGNRGIPLINVTGNHDLGYGSEISESNLRRFEQHFGLVNNKFTLEGHLLVNLNSLNLDPSYDESLRGQSWQHLASVENSAQPIILVTHLPLFKKSEVCSDKYATQFDSYGYVSSQNFLSENTTSYILNNIRPRFVFTGHDHEGCRHVHNERVHEFTLRSMMGDYSGFAGLFEIEPLDAESGQYRYHMGGCSFVPMPLITTVLVSWIVYLSCLIPAVVAMCLGLSL